MTDNGAAGWANRVAPFGQRAVIRAAPKRMFSVTRQPAAAGHTAGIAAFLARAQAQRIGKNTGLGAVSL
jgi:hypothetical protein